MLHPRALGNSLVFCLQSIRSKLGKSATPQEGWKIVWALGNIMVLCVQSIKLKKEKIEHDTTYCRKETTSWGVVFPHKHGDPGKLDENRLTAKHRAAFNVQMFDDADGNCSSLNTKQSTSKAFSQVEYGRRMHILDPENWGVGDLREMIESDKQKFQTFWLQHRREGCNRIGSFMVKSVTLPSTGKEAKRLYRLEHSKESGKKGTWSPSCASNRHLQRHWRGT